MELYQKVVKFVEDSFMKSNPHGNDVPHLKDTVNLIKELKPDADEALLIAAVSHDIERAYHDKEQMDKLGWGSPGYTKMHQEKGAEIMANFLLNLGADINIVNKVRSLISKHEVGGNEEETLLKDADSLSFFTAPGHVDYFLNEKIPVVGKEKVGKKFKWMFDRITSEKVKKIAEPIYKRAIRQLELK